jgi:hypothetical protein
MAAAKGVSVATVSRLILRPAKEIRARMSPQRETGEINGANENGGSEPAVSRLIFWWGEGESEPARSKSASAVQSFQIQRLNQS